MGSFYLVYFTPCYKLFYFPPAEQGVAFDESKQYPHLAGTVCRKMRIKSIWTIIANRKAAFNSDPQINCRVWHIPAEICHILI